MTFEFLWHLGLGDVHILGKFAFSDIFFSDIYVFVIFAFFNICVLVTFAFFGHLHLGIVVACQNLRFSQICVFPKTAFGQDFFFIWILLKFNFGLVLWFANISVIPIFRFCQNLRFAKSFVMPKKNVLPTIPFCKFLCLKKIQLCKICAFSRIFCPNFSFAKLCVLPKFPICKNLPFAKVSGLQKLTFCQNVRLN